MGRPSQSPLEELEGGARSALNLLSPRAMQGGFLYLTRLVFFYKIGEGMDTACKSVTFAAEIGTWLDSHRLDLY